MLLTNSEICDRPRRKRSMIRMTGLRDPSVAESCSGLDRQAINNRTDNVPFFGHMACFSTIVACSVVVLARLGTVLRQPLWVSGV